MAIEKRLVYPPGKNSDADRVEEYFDTEIGRVVPKPADVPAPEAADAAEAPAG